MSMRMKSLLLASAMTAAMLGISQDVSAEAAATLTLYVDNSVGDDISVINVAQQKVIATVKVGERPHAVCPTEDGRIVYTTTEREFALKAIDTATNTVVNTWPLPADPNECAVTKDGHYVVVPLRGNNTAVILDTTTNQFVKTLPIRGPHNCATPFGGSNDFVFCEEQRSWTMAKIDMKTMEIVDKLNVNGEARPFIVTPDMKTMYVALSDLGGVAIIDVPNKMVEQVVLPKTKLMGDCALEPSNTPTHGIGLTPDMKKLWITDVAGAAVYVLDLQTKKLSQPIAVGKCPNWFAISNDGKYVAVSNTGSDSVSIIDGKSYKVLSEIPVGKGPKRIDMAYVPARNS